MLAMYRFAAADPFTRRALPRFAELRRRFGAAAAARDLRRLRAERIPPRRPDAFAASARAAAVC
jgi:ferric-dicitrate binding protein FerR (iron transport regulator)